MRRPEPIRINIPKPCNEGWSKMTPTSQGKYCDCCKKCVVDFTGFSDRQLYNYFTDRSNEHICGRFYNTQLNRKINVPPQPRSLLYKYFIGLGLSLVFTQLTYDKVNARTFYTYHISEENKDGVNDNQDSTYITLRGQVIDDMRESIAGAVIQLSIYDLTKTAVVSDENGYYEINIPKEHLSDAELKIAYTTYIPQTIKLSSINIVNKMTIQLEIDHSLLNDITLVMGKVPFIRPKYVKEKTPEQPIVIDPFEPNKTVITSEDIEKMAK